MQGLPRTGGFWGIDRVDLLDPDLEATADAASDWTRTGALVFPLILGVVAGREEGPLRSAVRSSVIYSETLLISQGITLLAKNLIGRARPYAYVPAVDRPDGLAYDVSQRRTFRSMPSGHASAASAASAMGMTEYLLHRPSASWLSRVTVGFVGGALAGATSSLRVEAGQHFPTDVIAGSAIGVMVGVTVPLLHRGGVSAPTAQSWFQMTGGALVGALFGSVAGLEF